MGPPVDKSGPLPLASARSLVFVRGQYATSNPVQGWPASMLMLRGFCPPDNLVPKEARFGSVIPVPFHNDIWETPPVAYHQELRRRPTCTEFEAAAVMLVAAVPRPVPLSDAALEAMPRNSPYPRNPHVA